MEENVKKYFDLLTANLQKHLLNDKMPYEDKEKIKIRIELIDEIRHNITWQFKSEERKQVSRIHWLATMRRSNMPDATIINQEKAIRIYESIKLALPYVEALNSNLLKDTIIIFVSELCKKIDLAGKFYNKDFPSNTDIDNVFKQYFEIFKTAKGNSNMFIECYEHIDFLYLELKKLNENPVRLNVSE